MLLEKQGKKPKVKPKTPTNCYEIVITAMHGDADHEENRSIRIPDNREDLVEMLLHDIDVSDKHYSHDSIHESPFLRKWCEDGNDESIVNECKEISFTDWPNDLTVDRQFPCTFYGSPEVFHYDENGDKVPVKVKYTEEEKASAQLRRQETFKATKAAVEAEEKAERANTFDTRCAVCGSTMPQYYGERKTCSQCKSELVYKQRLFDADGETVTENDNPYESIEDIRTKLLPELDKLMENEQGRSKHWSRRWYLNRKVENHDKGLPEDA